LCLPDCTHDCEKWLGKAVLICTKKIIRRAGLGFSVRGLRDQMMSVVHEDCVRHHPKMRTGRGKGEVSTGSNHLGVSFVKYAK
jgi:hypothetical protein